MDHVSGVSGSLIFLHRELGLNADRQTVLCGFHKVGWTVHAVVWVVVILLRFCALVFGVGFVGTVLL